ncbi:MAG: sugar ABC transporter ATP-binding protein, partial [Acidimicrobiia bacterium]
MGTHTTSEDTQITDEPTMVLSGISKSYAGVAAITDVSLEILPGEIHALLGENGAGKSTLMGIASGEVEGDAGTIYVAGSLQPPLTPKLANSLGIAIVHQHPALLPDMTVAENIRLAVPAEYLGFAGNEEASMRALLDEVGMNVHLNDRANTLSIANQHLLEVAKALAVSPKVLILDEPTAPLGKESVDLLFEHVRSAASEGTAVVYITHRLAEVRLLADRVTVLRDGKVSGSANVDDAPDEQLLAWIVGRRLIGSTFPDKASAEAADEYVKVSDLSGQGFSHISVTANRGEIVGVAGVVGNGQSQLLAALAGLVPFKGSVHVNGTPYTSNALRTHAAYMPADRHREGLMMSLSVRENAAASSLRRFRRASFVRRDLETAGVNAEFDSLNVKTPSIEANVASLSGGNQQKVVMSRALLKKPAMLIADEPTQGVDVGARAEIYRIIREVAAGGIPVIVASSDAHELEGLCDRVIVMSRGQIVVELTGDAVTEERIVRAAVSATMQQDDQESPVSKARSS